MEDFDQVYRQNELAVRTFLTRLTGSAALAEELTQETFYKALRQWKSFRGDCAVTTWLCSIAKRLYYDACRQAQPLPLDAAPEPASRDVAEELADREQRIAAYRLLHSLPDPFKEVFTLRTFGELSHREIGALFGKTESWARVTYYRARQMLSAARDRMEEHHE